MHQQVVGVLSDARGADDLLPARAGDYALQIAGERDDKLLVGVEGAAPGGAHGAPELERHAALRGGDAVAEDKLREVRMAPRHVEILHAAHVLF